MGMLEIADAKLLINRQQIDITIGLEVEGFYARRTSVEI
jgi:hypothetical protein